MPHEDASSPAKNHSRKPWIARTPCRPMLPEAPSRRPRRGSPGRVGATAMLAPMEKTPKDDPKPDETPGAPEEGESYEDSWYQVLKRRAEEAPADDEATEE